MDETTAISTSVDSDRWAENSQSHPAFTAAQRRLAFPMNSEPRSVFANITNAVTSTTASVVATVSTAAATVVAAVTHKPGPRSLVDKMLAEYESQLVFVRSTDGRHFIGFQSRPHLVIALEPGCSVLQRIYEDWRARSAKAIPAGVKATFLETLRSRCAISPVIPVHTRAAKVGNSIWLDMGTDDGRVIHISPGNVAIENKAPVVFTRSNVTAAMPIPDIESADLNRLRKYLSIDEADFAMLVNALISTWFTDTAQPVIALLGPADSGKSSATLRLIDLIDPSTTRPGMSLPKKESDMRALLGIRRVLVFDNVSHINAEQSDLIARITSGSELSSRALYTDASAHIVTTWQPVVINGIMPGFARGDLASRSITPTMQPIRNRIPATTLERDWADDRGAIFSALVAVAAQVLADIQFIDDSVLDMRLADIQRNQIVVDRLLNAEGLARWREQLDSAADNVLDGNSVGMALKKWADESRVAQAGNKRHSLTTGREEPSIFGTHSITEVMDKLKDYYVERLPKDFPTSNQQLSTLLIRLSPEIERACGVRVERSPRGKQRGLTFTDMQAST